MRRVQATQIVKMLRKEPLSYRNFGIYWWHVKAELKRHGFDKKTLPHLGEYTDPDARKHYIGKRINELEEEAFVFQIEQGQHKYGSDHSFIPETGEVYIIQDQDVE